jgi:hypothetical protein
MSRVGLVGAGFGVNTGVGGAGAGAKLGVLADEGVDVEVAAGTGVDINIDLGVDADEGTSTGTRGGVGTTGARVLDLTPTVELGLGAHASSSKPLATGGTLVDLRIGRSGVEDLASGLCTLGVFD